MAPLLEATDDVSGVTAEKPQRSRREARRIPFIADDENRLLAADRRVPEVAPWVQPPLQNVAIDDERARNRSVALSLFQRSDVNENRPGCRRAVGIPWLQTDQARPRSIEERVNAYTDRTRNQMVCGSIRCVGGAHCANDIAPTARSAKPWLRETATCQSILQGPDFGRHALTVGARERTTSTVGPPVRRRRSDRRELVSTRTRDVAGTHRPSPRAEGSAGHRRRWWRFPLGR